MSKKVLIAMSGGVDSAYAAVRLKDQGYELLAVTFKVNDSDYTNDSIKDAKSICDKLGIPHIVEDYTDIFKSNVIDYFVTEYKNGSTPNPCVICNKTIKFSALNELRKKHCCDFVATGHYVRTENINGKIFLKKAINLKKDQSYFLNQVDKEILPYYIFPLGDVETKDAVRNFLMSKNIEIAQKKESQEICFVENNKLNKYLDEYITPKMGNIINEDKKKLGMHNGICSYTIGQRKGLGVTSDRPLYVYKIDAKTNEIYLGTEDKLFREDTRITDINVFSEEFLKKNDGLFGKIRYRAKEDKIESIEFCDEKIAKVSFTNLQKGITPGQYLVVYYNDYLVLGGKII